MPSLAYCRAAWGTIHAPSPAVLVSRAMVSDLPVFAHESSAGKDSCMTGNGRLSTKHLDLTTECGEAKVLMLTWCMLEQHAEDAAAPSPATTHARATNCHL